MCGGYDTRARVPCGDKMSLLKHAGISTWHSLTAVTMANICKWRRVPLSLWPCHRDSDTSHWTLNTLETGRGDWKREINGKRKQDNGRILRREKVQHCRLHYLSFSSFFLLTPCVIYRTVSNGPFASPKLFFCLCSAVERGTGLHGRDSLKWKCRLLPAVAKAHLIRG